MSTADVVTKTGRACPKCGGPVSEKRNRCYACTPGGKLRAPEPARPPVVASPPAAPRPAPPEAAVSPRQAVPSPPDRRAEPTPSPDREIAAMATILDALGGLRADASRRVLAYVGERLRAEQGDIEG